MTAHHTPTMTTTAARLVADYARLAVPAAGAVLVGFALNASWHAIQATLRQLDAPAELVLALPVILEPAALIYAGVWITRRRLGGPVAVVRGLFAAAAAVAVVYNVTAALPLDVLLPAGSPGRMAALAVSAALAPLTVVSVGHTALEEWAEWRASRRSLVDDVHAALEVEAQQALASELRGEFAGEVRAAVHAKLRAEMAGRLGLDAPRQRKPRRKAVKPAQVEGTTSGPAGNGSGPRNLTAAEVADRLPTAADVDAWVAEHGSKAAAAKALPTSRTTLARHLERVDASGGVS